MKVLGEVFNEKVNERQHYLKRPWEVEPQCELRGRPNLMLNPLKRPSWIWLRMKFAGFVEEQEAEESQCKMAVLREKTSEEEEEEASVEGGGEASGGGGAVASPSSLGYPTHIYSIKYLTLACQVLADAAVSCLCHNANQPAPHNRIIDFSCKCQVMGSEAYYPQCGNFELVDAP